MMLVCEVKSVSCCMLLDRDSQVHEAHQYTFTRLISVHQHMIGWASKDV